MAAKIVKEVEREEPTDKLVVENNEQPHNGSNIGVIIAVVILVILAIFLLSSLFNGGGASTPAPATGS